MKVQRSMMVLAAAVLVAGAWGQEDAALQKALATPVTVSFLDTPLDAALSYLQDQLEVPIVLSPEAGGDYVYITLDLKNLPLSQTLTLMLSLADDELAYVVEDGVILVLPRDRLFRRNLELRIHDIRDLMTTSEDFPGRNLDPSAQEEEEEFMEEDEPNSVLDADIIVDLIVTYVEPESWDLGQASVTAYSGLLFVYHTPEVQEKVASFLEGLRQEETPPVAVETRYFSLPRARVARVLGLPGDLEAPLLLDAKGRRALAREGVLLGQVALACLSAQRVSAATVHTWAYVRDLDVEVAASSSAYDPIIGVAAEGLALDVRPVVGGLEPAAEVMLEIRVDLVRNRQGMLSVPATAATAVATPGGGDGGAATRGTIGLGTLVQLPDVTLDRIRTVVRLPVGKGVLFPVSPALAGEDHVVLALVTATPLR